MSTMNQIATLFPPNPHGIFIIVSLPREYNFDVIEKEVYKTFTLKFDSSPHIIYSNNVTRFPRMKSEYSIVHVWRSPKANSRVMVAQNVCFDPYKGTIILYLPKDCSLDKSELHGGFIFIFRFK